jgi:predicted outer membrane repeat protein
MINTCQNLTITANHIVNNGGEWGAGIFCNYSNNITISENIIEQDSVLAQGGGIYADGENTTINDNIIRRNIAAEGAGIYFRGSRSTLINNLIEGNRACTNADTSCGGGVVSGGSNSLIISNVISDNMTLGDGGAICALNPWDCAIENNLVLSNSARSGGGISCRNGLKLIRNNILIENFAIEKGGGIHGFDEAMVLVENCILWQDSASLAPEISVDTGSIVVATYSDIGGGYPGRGIIDVDPLFRGPAGDDYHLSAVACGDTIDSPCIDNGDPAYSDSLLDCLWGLGDSRSDVGAFGGGQSTPNSRRRIYIPDDYPHIQAGIVAAHEGDTVVVRPGIYMGNIDFIGKRIIVGSLFLVTGDTSYMSSTIINGDSSGSVVEFTNGEDTSSIITGFTIQGGRRTGGIYCEDSSPSIVMNIIRNNSGTFGGGICCNQARPLIENNTIRENRAGYGGGIYCSHSSPTIRNNVITRCYSGA